MHLLIKLILIALLPHFHLLQVQLLQLQVNFIMVPDDGAPLVENIFFVVNRQRSECSCVCEGLSSSTLNCTQVLSASIESLQPVCADG